MKDYYALLGLQPDCEAEDLKIAFRKMVLLHHPDRGGDEAHFRELMEAYETLSDEALRAEYDIQYVEAFPGFTLVDADTGEELEVEYEDQPQPPTHTYTAGRDRVPKPNPRPDNGKGLMLLLVLALPALGFGFGMLATGDPLTAGIVAGIALVAALAVGALLRD